MVLVGVGELDKGGGWGEGSGGAGLPVKGLLPRECVGVCNSGREVLLGSARPQGVQAPNTEPRKCRYYTWLTDPEQLGLKETVVNQEAQGCFHLALAPRSPGLWATGQIPEPTQGSRV